jgi:hypothetical protein
MNTPARTLYWEQWLILIGICSVLILSLQWGVPNKKRMACLVGGKPLTEQQERLLTSVRNYWRQQTETRKAREAREAMQGKKVPHLDGPLRLTSPVATEEERLADFHSFVVGTPDHDEIKTYAVLYRMKPSKLDFDFKSWYGYGGSYIYPLGSLLYVAKTLGLLEVTDDFMYYVRHPENTATMYSIGRLMNLAAFLGILFLLCKLGQKIAGRLAGTGAMLAFGLSTLALYQSLVSKPHMYAAFFMLLSVYIILQNLERPSIRRLVLAAAAAGWAFGASVVAGAVALLLPFLLLDFRETRGSVFRILLCWAVMGLVFLLANPYAVLNTERYLLDFTSIGFFSSYNFLVVSGGKAAGYFREMLMQSYFLPVSAFGILGIIVACVRESGFTRRLGAGTLFLLLLMSVTVNNARITLFAGPLLCLFSGYGLYRLAHYLAGVNKFCKTALLILAFAPGVFFAAMLVRDVVQHDYWYDSTMEWIKSERIGETTSIGVFERPSPTNTPPYPFVNADLVNLYGNTPIAKLPQYVVIAPSEKPGEWEQHPSRSRYELRFNLGYRPSYHWFLSWRTRPPQTAALVYKLRTD